MSGRLRVSVSMRGSDLRGRYQAEVSTLPRVATRTCSGIVEGQIGLP